MSLFVEMEIEKASELSSSITMYESVLKIRNRTVLINIRFKLIEFCPATDTLPVRSKFKGCRYAVDLRSTLKLVHIFTTYI